MTWPVEFTEPARKELRALDMQWDRKCQPTAPGELLVEEYLVPLGVSQQAFARHVGWSLPKVNEIVRGKRGITPDTAMALAEALNTTPEFWLNAQMSVDLWRARRDHKPVKKLPQLA